MIGRVLRKRWVRRVGLTVLVLALLVALAAVNTYFTLRGRGERHRDAVVAHLDATDPGWRYEQIEAARRQNLPPPERNAVELAVKLRDRIPEEAYREWGQVDTGKHTRRPGELPSAEELAHARTLVNACRDLLPEARGLRHLSGGVIAPLAENPLATLLTHAQKMREVATLLQQDALVAAADGRADDAVDDCLAMLAIARGLRDEPFLISHLVRIAITSAAVRTAERTLWLCEPGDTKLAELQAALEAEATVPGLVTALRGERAGMSKFGDFLERDPGQVTGLIAGGGGKAPPKAAVAVAASALLPETHARFLELMTRAIAVAEKPPGPERDEEFARIEKEVAADTSLEGQGVKLVYPAVSRCYEADVRATAVLLAAAAAVEAERHRLRTGNYPADWSFRPAPPTDPFTAKPMVFKPTDDGLTVHSAGPAAESEIGKQIRRRPDWSAETDLGFRLFDVKHRRQPPSPPPPDPEP